MLLSFPLSLLIVATVFATSILSGIVGMAGGMVLMGVLVSLLPVQQAMILHAISQFFANASRAFIHRKHIHLPAMRYYFSGMAVTIALFMLVAFVPDKAVVYLLLGIGPFVSFFLPKHLALDISRPLHAFACGLLVTGFQLTGGVSGSLLDMFFQTRALTRHQTVATKAFTQSISHLSKFVYFGFIVSTIGIAMDGLPFWLCLAVIPVALAGSHTSKYILERLSDVQFYKVTQTLVLGIGGLFLCRGLWMLIAPPL